MYFMHGFGGGWFGLLWLMLAAGVVALIILGSSRRRQVAESPHDDAMRILKERYARGEIAREEFEQKARDIRGA